MRKSCNVMILGGGGFIGQNLARFLVEREYDVSVFDQKTPKNKIHDVRYIEGDFFSDRSLDVLREGQDIIIHALSTVNPGNSNSAYLRGYGWDFLQTINLFDRLSKTGTRLLFISSAGTVYGRYGDHPFDEADPLRPINHYGSIKACVETAMRAFNEQQHTRFLSCRISNPYGPGQDSQKGVGFIDAAIKSILNRRPLEVWGDGSVVRDYIYIEDVCRMMEALIRYEGNLQTFNISTGIGTSQNEIIDIFRNLGYKLDVRYLKTRSVDAKYNIVSNHKVVAATGCTCMKLEEGIARYMQWLGTSSERMSGVWRN